MLYDFLNLLQKNISDQKSNESENDLWKVLHNNKIISGAFDKLSEKDQDSLVNSVNKIQDYLNKVFDIETDKKLASDDFKDSKVSVHSYSSDNDEDEKKNLDNSFVKGFTDAISSILSSLNTKDDEENSTKEPVKSAMKNTEKKSQEHTIPVTDGNEVKTENENCAECKIENCSNRTSEFKPKTKEKTIREELLDELKQNTVTIEDDVNEVVEMVLAILNDKVNKNYKLHPAKDKIPPAVEVVVPSSVVKPTISKDVNVQNLLREKLKEAIGSTDAYIRINPEEDGMTIYIPLN